MMSKSVCATVLLALTGCSSTETPGDDAQSEEMNASSTGGGSSSDNETGDGDVVQAMGGHGAGSGESPEVEPASGGSNAGTGGGNDGTGGDDSEGWVPIFDGMSTDGWEAHAHDRSTLRPSGLDSLANSSRRRAHPTLGQ